MLKYQVIEDNGGGPTLAVFEGENVTYLHTGYEYNVGQLTNDLDALKSGDNPAEDWEGNEENPQDLYDNIASYEFGWKIVADQNGIYPEDMGAAAKEEFKIEK